MNYEMVPDPAKAGNFFLRGASGHTGNSFPYKQAVQIQNAMEVAYQDGGFDASVNGAKIAAALVKRIVEVNNREAILTMEAIVDAVKKGQTEMVEAALADTKKEYARRLSVEAGLPKSNQE